MWTLNCSSTQNVCYFKQKGWSSSPKLKQHKIAQSLLADALLNNAHFNSRSFIWIQKPTQGNNFLPCPEEGLFPVQPGTTLNRHLPIHSASSHTAAACRLQGSHLTTNEPGFSTSRRPARRILEASQREVGNLTTWARSPVYHSFLLTVSPLALREAPQGAGGARPLTLVLQSLKIPHQRVFGLVCHTAHHHTYTGNCNPLQASGCTASVALAHTDNFQLTPYCYC